MKKVFICLIGCVLLALTSLRAQDVIKADTVRSPMDSVGQGQGGSVISRDTTTSPVKADTPKDTVIAPAKPADGGLAKVDAPKDTAITPARDTTIRLRDTTMQVKDTVISLADDINKKPAPDTTSKKPAAIVPKDSALAKTDKPASDSADNAKGKLDDRWFIAPLTRGQYQDFGMLEKNRKGYLSDADKLPLSKRGNGSLAVSAYRNITQRLSISADFGLSFGHATNDDVLISQTKSHTFNLLNAALYYHLLDQSSKLQPYITIGINDIVNEKSYTSIPMGVGAKYTGRKVMVTGQLTYGAAMNKGVANTTMYSLGVYIPIKNTAKKKSKPKDKNRDDSSAYNRPGKDDNNKKDTASKGIVNNIYITINMDSVLKAKGLLDDNGKPRRGGSGDDDDDDGSDGGRKRRARKPFRSLGLDDFGDDEYRIDSMGGKPTLRFVVYFEFNEYGLNSSAFAKIDKVIDHLRRSQEFYIEIKGYTDSVGANNYNNWLSRKRANMVKDYINSRGVPHEWMKAKAYGSDNPVGNNSDPNEAWLNRRAEIIVHRKDAPAEESKGAPATGGEEK